MTKELVWWTRWKEMKRTTFLFGQFFKFLLKKKIWLKKEVLSSSQFAERRIKMMRKVRVNGPALRICLVIEKKKTENSTNPKSQSTYVFF